MLIQLIVILGLVLLMAGAIRMFSGIFRAAAGLFSLLIFVQWLARASHDFWLLLYELGGLILLLFLFASGTGHLRRRW
jgi:hypothetical protein